MSVSADSNQPFIRLLLHKPPFQPIQTPILSAPTKNPLFHPKHPKPNPPPPKEPIISSNTPPAHHIQARLPPTRPPGPQGVEGFPPLNAQTALDVCGGETQRVFQPQTSNTVCTGSEGSPEPCGPEAGGWAAGCAVPIPATPSPTENQTTKSDSTPVYPQTISNHP